MENERKEGLKGRINYNPALSLCGCLRGTREETDEVPQFLAAEHKVPPEGSIRFVLDKYFCLESSSLWREILYKGVICKLTSIVILEYHNSVVPKSSVPMPIRILRKALEKPRSSAHCKSPGQITQQWANAYCLSPNLPKISSCVSYSGKSLKGRTVTKKAAWAPTLQGCPTCGLWSARSPGRLWTRPNTTS